MKKVILLVRFLAVSQVVFLIFGCLISQIEPFEKAANSWIGHSIKEIREINKRSGSYASRIGWKETTYQLNNGHWVYVEPDRKDCLIHWEVNQEDKIINYTIEGDGCK